MRSAASHPFLKVPFPHKGVTYEVVAYQEPGDNRLFVTAEAGGQAVVFTYPDGFKAALVYSVDPIMAVDFMQATGNSAVEALIDTAKGDIARLI